MPKLLRLRAPGGAASLFALAALTAALCAAPTLAPTLAQEPIKIGFSMALTGPLAPNGKQALLGMKIWEEEINKKGGLLGRRLSWSITTTSRTPRRCRASTPSCSMSTRSIWLSVPMPPP